MRHGFNTARELDETRLDDSADENTGDWTEDTGNDEDCTTITVPEDEMAAGACAKAAPPPTNAAKLATILKNCRIMKLPA